MAVSAQRGKERGREAPRAKARGISTEPAEAKKAIPPRGIRLRAEASARHEPRGFLAKEGERNPESSSPRSAHIVLAESEQTHS
jgi:hypothetical protein